MWLESHPLQDPSHDESSQAKITTSSSVRTDATSILVRVDDRHRADGCFRVEFGDRATAQEITYSKARLSNQVASDAHFDLIQGWLQACTDRAQHPACNIDRKFRRPTRLLDIACFYEDVRLISGEDSDSPYAALSYSWGAISQLKLLRSNLEEFQDRIPFARLSRVAQDAIHVCRRLSISCLWIDALCIIQGDDGDFSTEAPRMQDVYAGSLLTIVAADSNNTTETFLGQRNPLTWLKCTLGSSSGTLFTVVPTPFCTRPERPNRPGQCNIDSRAWCLQERFMSPRSIFFGANGVHWDCRQGLCL